MPGWDCHGLPIELKGKCVMMVNFVSFGPMEFSWDLLYLVWLVCQFENWASTSEPLSLNLVNISFSGPVKCAVSVDNYNLIIT